MMKASVDSLFKMKEEYLFVFAGVGDNTTVEVLDVGRGIWRNFEAGSLPNRTKSVVLPINSESLAIIGGKDEVSYVWLNH